VGLIRFGVSAHTPADTAEILMPLAMTAAPGAQRQYLYSCTRKASKLRTRCEHIHRKLVPEDLVDDCLAAPFASVFVLLYQ
jgi:hypothetical protein